MPTFRRVYIYVVAFVSLESALWGAISLARALVSPTSLNNQPARMAGALSLVVVGLPVFLLGWRLTQRSADHPAEQLTRVRAVFLYAILLFTLVPVIQNVLALVSHFWVAFLGLSPGMAWFENQPAPLENLVAIALNLLVAGWALSTLHRDQQETSPGMEFSAVGRVYHSIWLVYALALVVFGAQQLILFGFSLVEAGDPAGEANLTTGLTLLLVGLPVWLLVESRTVREAVDAGSVLPLPQLGLFYALRLFTNVGMLLSLGLALNALLQAVLTGRTTPDEILTQIGLPLSIALPFGAAWLYYRRAHFTRATYAGTTSASENTIPSRGLAKSRQMRVWRWFAYTLAFLGLAAAFTGLHLILIEIAASALANQPSPPGRLAGPLSLLVIGLPVWLRYWRPLAREVALEGDFGDQVRRSQARKIYLYLVITLGLAGLTASAGGLVFQLLRTIFGEPSPETLSANTWLGVSLVLFGVLLAYHMLVQRSAAQQARQALSRRHAQFPVLVLTPEDEEFAQKLVNALEREVVGLPIAVHAYRLGAPDETLSAAKAVILPAELVARPSEALRLWLQGYTGARLVVPTPVKDWLWIPNGNRSLSRLASRTARVVRQLAEGEELHR